MTRLRLLTVLFNCFNFPSLYCCCCLSFATKSNEKSIKVFKTSLSLHYLSMRSKRFFFRSSIGSHFLLTFCVSIPIPTHPLYLANWLVGRSDVQKCLRISFYDNATRIFSRLRGEDKHAASQV